MNAIRMLMRCGKHQSGDGHTAPTGCEGRDSSSWYAGQFIPESDRGIEGARREPSFWEDEAVVP